MNAQARAVAFTKWTSRKVFVEGLIIELDGRETVDGLHFPNAAAQTEFYDKLDKYDTEHRTELGSN